jgi:hypothetical protein
MVTAFLLQNLQFLFTYGCLKLIYLVVVKFLNLDFSVAAETKDCHYHVAEIT